MRGPPQTFRCHDAITAQRVNQRRYLAGVLDVYSRHIVRVPCPATLSGHHNTALSYATVAMPVDGDSGPGRADRRSA